MAEKEAREEAVVARGGGGDDDKEDIPKLPTPGREGRPWPAPPLVVRTTTTHTPVATVPPTSQ